MSDAEAGAPVRDVARALEELRGRIERACAQAGRDASEISILAVTKGFGPEAIEAAISANIADIGENYLQEAQAKFARVIWPSRVRRHFIGSVQRNKARKIAALFDVVETVDSVELADALDRGAADAGKTLDVLIQVNVAGDARNGIAPDESLALGRRFDALSNLRLRGVMAVGPIGRTQSGAAFKEAADAFDALARAHAGIDTLSMGMSDDLEAAVAAGSTLVRIGTALFGPRPTKGKG
ncbi:MAG: YggS family pyridoxal phosphate-dependent enzyme [Candidatus Eremiobacteraeota bacterium]|nr:YggS family pyridoxal phosphate-dependent enzyme [Candidatus Eremiobacteraeota bacterium]